MRKAGKDLTDKSKSQRFEEIALPHLNAAYNLARWLTRSDLDAEDVVQEAYRRALEYFESFRGGDVRRWLLTIVRNSCYTWLRQRHPDEVTTAFDEEVHGPESVSCNADLRSQFGKDPETLLLEHAEDGVLHRAIEELPLEFREVLVLREMEELSYKEISIIANVPIGTVMSRLARARRQLRDILITGMAKEH